MKYTAEEVRAIAKRLHDDITVADGDALRASDMLTAYAARIEADEMAADYPECSGDPASYPENEGFGCCKAHAEAITLHPPAQAVQSVDAFADRLRQSIMRDTFQPTADPVAQGEPVAGIQVPREGMPRVAQFIPYPAWLRLPPGIHDLFTTPPAQPAERVPKGDREMIRQIAYFLKAVSSDGKWWHSQSAVNPVALDIQKLADKLLTAAQEADR